MLTISTHQMQAIDAAQSGLRDAAFLRYARARFGSHLDAVDDGRLIEAGRQVRRLAGDWGIVAERDVSTVFDLVVMYGGKFFQADWAADILSVDDWDGARKTEALRVRVRRTVPGF